MFIRSLSILFLFSPLLMWGQSKTYLDSVNYYFGILLNNERDSINQYRIKHNTGGKILNFATEETDESKFVNPWKHIDYCIEESHQMKKFNAHSTTNKENMMFHKELVGHINNFIESDIIEDFYPLSRRMSNVKVEMMDPVIDDMVPRIPYVSLRLTYDSLDDSVDITPLLNDELFRKPLENYLKTKMNLDPQIDYWFEELW